MKGIKWRNKLPVWLHTYQSQAIAESSVRVWRLHAEARVMAIPEFFDALNRAVVAPQFHPKVVGQQFRVQGQVEVIFSTISPEFVEYRVPSQLVGPIEEQAPCALNPSFMTVGALRIKYLAIDINVSDVIADKVTSAIY